MTSEPVLTPEQREHFLNHGWVKIPKAFTEEQAAQVTKNVWTRLGMDPHDKSTWHTIRTNMPSHQTFDAAHFAPRAWAAICELCGGEGRVNPTSREWRDSLIVNLGSAAYENQPDPPQALTGWHVDGDFFIHYLDSPEQALLVVPLFTDVPPQGGGTALYPAGMRAVAAHLHAHPEGVSPRMVPRGEPGFSEGYRNLDWFNTVAGRGADEDYVEASGEVGDVYLLHPLMLHSSTNNSLRNVRIITNPPVSLREPFRLDRSGGEQEEEGGRYSLVERATLRMLGREDGLKGWKITREREAVIPERLKVQERMKQEELKRLAEERSKAERASAAATAV